MPSEAEDRLAPMREEINALREIASRLEPFDTDTQQRMLRWVCARFAPQEADRGAL